MKEFRMISVFLVLISLAAQIGRAQTTVQAGIFNTPQGSNILSVKAKPSGALNGVFSGVNVTIRWLTSYNITLTLVSSSFGLSPQGGVGTSGSFSYQIFGNTNNPTINWAANSENELFTARVDGNSGTGTFELLHTVEPTVWFFEFGGINLTNTTTPFYVQSVGGVALPVQLVSFTGTVVNGSHVRLDWRTISEINNYGFYVERKRHGDSTFTEIPNSFIPGHGTTNEPHSYTFTDQSPGAVIVSYRLRQVDLDGTRHYTDPIVVTGILVSVQENELAPIEFSLKQNYPNPFNPTTEIKFSVETVGRTTLEVFNIIGQRVATLFDDVAEPGRYYRMRFSGENLASGVYLYRLQSGKKSELKKLLLMK